ncbi:hypothetical protein [Actinomadura sp. 6N118]|uniref:hypothetical protein n=1 Tax=Actinomadura sp. 6N118 TaxID=3375151 RepID=UPI0037AE16C6
MSMKQRVAVLGAIVVFPLGIATVSQALSDAPGEPAVPPRVQVGGDSSGSPSGIPTTPSGTPATSPQDTSGSPAPPSTRAPKSPGPSRRTVVPQPPPVYDDDDGAGGDDGDDG